MSLRRDRNMGGFTLIEMAIVIVLMAIMVGGVAVTIGAQQRQQSARDARRDLDEIKQALIGYAASQGSKPYLPCPATVADTGVEALRDASGDCPQLEGRLPWVTLGLGEADPWGSRYRYSVTATFANSKAGFTLADDGDLTVCAANPCVATAQLATGVPAVVVSHGANRAGAFLPGGGAAAASTEPNEADNSNGDPTFVSGADTEIYDDFVMWLSPHVLKQRMIQIGSLP